MKKQFNPQYIRDNKGCYDMGQVDKLSFISKPEIDIMDIINSEMPTKDKCWWIFKKCDLTLTQKRELSYLLAESVAEIYNAKYPNDNRVNECIKAIKDFNNGIIDRDQLMIFSYAAAAAVYTYAADAADAAAAAVYTYADAAAAADTARKNQNKVLAILTDFIKNNE